MQEFSKKIFQLFVLAILSLSVGLESSSGQVTSTDGQSENLRKAVADIANFHSPTYERSLRALFATPPNGLDLIMKFVGSSNVDESKGAQFIIRYLGGDEHLDQMLELCNSRCFLSGPIPIPLHPLDAKELEYLLNKTDLCKLSDFNMKYVYAAFFDNSSPSRELRNRVEEKARYCPKDSIFVSRLSALQTVNKRQIEVGIERSVELVRDNLFFLTDEERKRAKLQYLGVNYRGDRALFEILIDNGVLANRYIHVVFLKNGENKWRFYSVTQVSQS